MSVSDFFDGFTDDDFALEGRQETSYPQAERETFPCQRCAGTGKYPGRRTNQQQDNCFSCKGVGHFLTSPFARFKARDAKAKSKEARLTEARAEFNEANPGLIDWLQKNAYSPFLQDMVAAFVKYGSLSEKQTQAVARSRAQSQERLAQRDLERNVQVDLSAIHTMFATARDNGLNRLVYRAEGLVLSPAKADSSNAGAIYVKTADGTYLGKVIGTTFRGTADATDEHKQLLAKIAKNPSEVAREYGIRTGRCSCCGRELTDPVSVSLGIGPICAEGWGF